MCNILTDLFGLIQINLIWFDIALILSLYSVYLSPMSSLCILLLIATYLMSLLVI